MVEENFENNHSQIFQISLLHLLQEYDDKNLSVDNTELQYISQYKLKSQCNQYIWVHFSTTGHPEKDIMVFNKSKS